MAGRPTRPPRSCWSTAHHDVQPVEAARGVGQPAVPARRTRRAAARPGAPPTTRARCSSTPSGVRANLAALRRPGRRRFTLKFLIEGEEESGLRALRRPCSAASGDRLACDVDRDQRHHHVGPLTCRPCAPACAGCFPVGVTLTGPVRGPALRLVRRRRAEPRWQRDGGPCWPALHDEQERVTLPRFLRPRACRSPTPNGNLIARLPFDEKQWLAEAGESGAAHGEAGLQHAGADLGPADRRDQTGMWGRAHGTG